MPVVDFNNLVNDSGGGLDGTPIDKAEFQALLMGTTVASTSTGAVNNWAPGLAGHTYIAWSGAADATISGLAGGIASQRVLIRNTGTKVAYILHQSGLSSAANRFANAATSGATPIATGGWALYHFDGGNWQLVAHEQGAWITPTYAGGDYTASTGTWTVDSGDILRCAWRLDGRTLSIAFRALTTSVSATPIALRRAMPGGFSATVDSEWPIWVSNNAGAWAPGMVAVVAGANPIQFARDPSYPAWATATNATGISAGSFSFEVT